jgi:curved DNA-binding protein CbpA
MYARAAESFRMSSEFSTVNRLENDFYAVLGVKRTATKEEIREAFKRLASQYHPDRNKDEDAAQKFKEASEAYFVLSDPAQRHLYDVLGPNKYDDPREVTFYRLNQEAANRELEREYEKERSARQYKDVEGLGFIIFILIVVDFFIPSWVLGPWFYVLNAFAILAIAVGIYEQIKD